MLMWFLIGWPVVAFGGGIFCGRCMAVGMGSSPTPSEAGRTLGKISPAEAKRRQDAKTAELRAELGR